MSNTPAQDLSAPVELQPRGYPRPSGLELASYGAIGLLGLVVIPVLLASAARMPVTSWSWGLAGLEVTGSDPTAGTTLSVSAPSPLAFLMLLVGLEGYRLAWARSLRVVLQPEGLLRAEQGIFRRRTWQRSLESDATIEQTRAGVEVAPSTGEPLLLRGLDADDAAALRDAVGRLRPSTSPVLVRSTGSGSAACPSGPLTLA